MIKNTLTYQPFFKDLSTEEDVIRLIQDVRTDISVLNPIIAKLSLNATLKIIDKGFYKIKREDGIYDALDLSKANSLIQRYRFISEGKGCQSCQHIEYVKPFPDETISYCKLNEDEEGVIKNFAEDMSETRSSQIKEHFTNGCKDRKSITKSLIKILLEVEEN